MQASTGIILRISGREWKIDVAGRLAVYADASFIAVNGKYLFGVPAA
jgi:hypothetical protein